MMSRKMMATTTTTTTKKQQLVQQEIINIDDDYDDDGSFLDNFDVDKAIMEAGGSTRKPHQEQGQQEAAVATVIQEQQQQQQNHHHDVVNYQHESTIKRRRLLSTTDDNDDDSSVNHNNNDVDSSDNDSSSLSYLLHETLEHFFGYKNFRNEQLNVIQHILQRKGDCVVFWSTGAGKSLCYQIPALISLMNNKKSKNNKNNKNMITTTVTTTTTMKNIVIVVSPLISLMQDQVHQLNGLGYGNDIATFLGSAQTNQNQIEAAVLRGEYSLVYITPEKLTSNDGNFLHQLEYSIQQSKHLNLCLFAIDESHCVSEWGHDFRTSYRNIGNIIRNHPSSQIRQVPIVALTATAIPQVQNDIIQSLQLHHQNNDNNNMSLYISKQSLDRPNLRISVKKLVSGNIIDKVWELLCTPISMMMTTSMTTTSTTSTTSTAGGTSSCPSTIIYVSTQKQVQEVTTALRQRSSSYNDNNNASTDGNNSNIIIEGYHGSMSTMDRTRIHTDFLTGIIHVVIATIAFGMGIDKPDIRRIIHIGPTKTIEEYYQQIGRAGRDGHIAECNMYLPSTGTASSQFDKYKTDFYLGNLTSTKARESVIRGIHAMRNYVTDNITCRRIALLQYFNNGNYNTNDKTVHVSNNPSIKSASSSYQHRRCGTCDNCVNYAKYSSINNNDSATTANHHHHLNNIYERDFRHDGALVVLYAIDSLREQGLTNIMKVINGNIIETHRYNNNIINKQHGGGAVNTPKMVQTNIEAYKNNNNNSNNNNNNSSLNETITTTGKRNTKQKRRPQSYYRELVLPLVQKGYLIESSKKMTTLSGFTNTWTVYSTTTKGKHALRNDDDNNEPIILPIPETIREIERIEEEHRQKVLAELEKSFGQHVVQQLPQEEINNGDGEIIRTYMKWQKYRNRYIVGIPSTDNTTTTTTNDDNNKNNNSDKANGEDKKKKPTAVSPTTSAVIDLSSTTVATAPTVSVGNNSSNNNSKRVQDLDELISSIEQWRTSTAITLRTAPVSVLAEYKIPAIAYIVATMKPGAKIDEQSLFDIGVRSKHVHELVQTLWDWVDRAQPGQDNVGINNNGTGNGDDDGAVAESPSIMDFSAGDGCYQPKQPWKYAVYKVIKKTGMASWESSYNRFMDDGISPIAIAMTPTNGKQPIQVSTVIGHLLEALIHGKKLDLRRLSDFCISSQGGGLCGPPTMEEWEKLDVAGIQSGMNIIGDPEISGRDHGKFTMTDYIRPIVGDTIVNIPSKERTEEQKQLMSYWYEKMKWYIILRRVQYIPTFITQQKEQYV